MTDRPEMTPLSAPGAPIVSIDPLGEPVDRGRRGTIVTPIHCPRGEAALLPAYRMPAGRTSRVPVRIVAPGADVQTG